MKGSGFIRLIDPAFPGKGEAALTIARAGTVPVHLFPDAGEYATALRKIKAFWPEGPLGREVPDEFYLHLYAAEVLERMRERALEKDRDTMEILVFPFWPACLFEAAGIWVNGVREIQALFLQGSATHVVRRGPADLAAAACRVLGELRFETAAYEEALYATVTREGWKWIEA